MSKFYADDINADFYTVVSDTGKMHKVLFVEFHGSHWSIEKYQDDTFMGIWYSDECGSSLDRI